MGVFFIKAIYVYLIAFVSALMILGGGVSIFTAIGNYIYPKVDIPTRVEFVFSNEKLWQEYQTAYHDSALEINVYDRYVADIVKPYKEQALNELIKSIGWTLIPLMFFTYFQTQINRFKRTPN